MRFSARQKINLGVSVALLLTIGVSAVAHWSVRRTAEAGLMVSHTYQVLQRLEEKLSTLQWAESAQRGYIVTAQREYLEEYSAALEVMSSARGSLRRLVSDNLEQQQDLDSLNALIDRRVALMNAAVAARQSEGFDAARQQVELGPGADVMEIARSLVFRMQLREEELLRRRQEAADRETSRTSALLWVSTALAMLLLILGAVLLNRGLSQREQTEVALRAARDAADSANQAKSEFLATISHEIRTPLNAVLGMTELALDTGLDPEQEELVRTARANTEWLLLLINDLLDSSKIEAGEMDLQAVPTSVRAVVEGVAEILSLRAEAKSITLVTFVDAEVPSRILIDPTRLRQVVLNLVGNAVKFTRKGEVAVWVDIDRGAEGNSELRIRVSDTGIGIEAADQERIFNRFVQADASTVRRFGGTGLGLNISRSLVQLMGGRIGVESEPGIGSVFHVHLPLQAEPEVALQPDATMQEIHVLVADEVGIRRAAISETLRSAGMRVTEAADAAEGAELAKNEDIDVLVTDERLLTLLRVADSGGPPVVALYDRHVMARSDRRQRTAGHLYKPVRQARLIAAVRSAAGLEVEKEGDEEPRSLRPAKLVGHPRILLVEDNLDNSALATRFLVEAGYEVDVAGNGRLAVERAERFRYDLILMDVEMPVLDGFGATRAIRALESREERDPTPIVALTAHAAVGFRELGLAAGMNDYATKPIDRESLIELAHRWSDARPVLLVADDSPENLLIIQSFLRSQPFRILTARNGREAIEAFQQQRVSAVLLDMDMPVVSGYQVAEILRGTSRGKDVPIVAMTGYDGPQERQRCLAAGCSEYLPKPLRRGDLLRLFVPLLGGVEELEDEASEAGPTGFGPDPGLPPDLAGPVQAMIERMPRRLLRRDFGAIRHEAGLLREHFLRAERADLTSIAGELESAALSLDEAGVRFWRDRLVDQLRPHRSSGETGAALQSETTADAGSSRLAASTAGADSAAAAAGTPIREMAVEFLRHRDQELGRIQRLAEQGRLDEAARLGHQIYGSAGVFGFAKIGEAGRAMQDAARVGDERGVLDAAHSLRKLIGESLMSASSLDTVDGAPRASVESVPPEDGLTPFLVDEWRASDRRLRRLVLEENFEEIRLLSRMLHDAAVGAGQAGVIALAEQIEAAAVEQDMEQLQSLSREFLELLESAEQ